MKLLLIIGSVLVLLADGKPSPEHEHGDQNRTATSSNTSTTTSASELSEGRMSGDRRGGLTSSLSALARNQTALMNFMSIFDSLDIDVLATPTTSPPSKGHKGSHTTRRETTGGIAFPTSPPKIRNSDRNGSSQKASPLCSSPTNLCEFVDQYPMNDVNVLLTREVDKYNEYFESPSNATEIVSRDSGVAVTSQKQLCKSVSRVIAPQGGKNLNGEYKIIAKNEAYQQAIVVEQCVEVGKPCDYVEYFPPHIDARCVQKYVTRRLVTVNKESKGLETDKFQVPSCCSCELRLKNSDR